MKKNIHIFQYKIIHPWQPDKPIIFWCSTSPMYIFDDKITICKYSLYKRIQTGNKIAGRRKCTEYRYKCNASPEYEISIKYIIINHKIVDREYISINKIDKIKPIQ